MKVLVVGSYGFMMNYLIERLRREQCEIYTIAGKNSKMKAIRLPAHSIYEFEPGDVAVKYIIRSVLPDAIVFLGAQDDGYDWEKDRTSAQYAADLSNVLIWAKAYGVKRFLYLSSMAVFGGNAGERLAPEREPKPAGSAGMTAYSGECLCRLYHDAVTAVTILRFPEVYGPSHFLYEKLNPMEQLCLDGKISGTIQREDPVRSMAIYVSDAVDAVYKALCNPRPQELLYQVEGASVVSDKELAERLQDLCGHPVRAREWEEEGCLSLDGSRFAAEFSYAPHVELSTGLARTFAFVDKNSEYLVERDKAAQAEEKNRGKKRWKDDLRMVAASGKRLVENLALFLVSLLLVNTLGSMELFERVDFMLLYILIAAIGLGVGHSVLAVVLATGANLYFAMRHTGLGFSTLIAQYPFIFGFLFYLILAIIVSYTILRFKLRLREQEERANDIQEEYDMLYEVDNTNVEIKHAFEQRLLNYGDSIGKVYSIVSELDVLDPEKVAQSSLGVVQKIMKVKDVSLYRAGQEGYFHLSGATGQEALGMKRAFRLDDYPELRRVLGEPGIYVDRTVGSEMPRMAAPIYSGGRMIYIIMLWNMKFDQLNVYQKDLFLVLSRIITASLERSYRYEEAGRDRKYYPGTDILLPEAFRQRMEEKLGSAQYEEADYSLIRVDAQGEALEALSNRLKLLTREDDRLGKLKDEDAYVYILVHANYADSSFVVKKLNNNGIKSEAVLADGLQQ
ncbi:MAG: NAD-dependent epimerase/dehydratase family protein [Clostridiales bacterium]|nr:NAD-dependent epimerase/dehydratase family protein [Clostridiales bacterium]